LQLLRQQHQRCRNLYSGYGIVDVVGGGAANFTACMLATPTRRGNVKRRFLGCLVETATVTIIVGSYLSLIYEVPIEVSLIGLLVGSLISINILGFALLEALYRRGIKEKYDGK